MHDVEATVTRIVDGDTFVCTVHAHILDIRMDLPNQYVRIIGVDTPEDEGETKEAGDEAKFFLESFLLNQRVQLHSEGKRSFHRLLAEVYLADGRNVSDVIIEAGMGVPYID